MPFAIRFRHNCFTILFHTISFLYYTHNTECTLFTCIILSAHHVLIRKTIRFPYFCPLVLTNFNILYTRIITILCITYHATPTFECKDFSIKKMSIRSRGNLLHVCSSCTRVFLNAEMNAANRICTDFLTDFLRLRARRTCHVSLFNVASRHSRGYTFKYQ